MPVGCGSGINKVPPHRHYPRAFCTPPGFVHIKKLIWRPVELNNGHLRSHGKIGDCEQFIPVVAIVHPTQSWFMAMQVSVLATVTDPLQNISHEPFYDMCTEQTAD